MRRLAPLTLLALAFPALGGDETFKLLPSDAAPEDRFGDSVSISGNLALVGVPFDQDNGVFSGSAYLFDASTGQQLVKLLADDGSPGDWFGDSVAISGTTALVGASREDQNGFSAGAAYLFDTTNGQQLAKLLASDGESGNRFGFSVAISGTTALVGAPYDEDNGESSGSAYLFDATTGQQLAKLLPNDGVAGDRFGFSVSTSETRALVGAIHDDDNGNNSGSAYLFDTATGQQVAKLLPGDGATGDDFGSSVSISGDMALVGAFGDDDSGDQAGSAYLFDITTGQQLLKLLSSDPIPGAFFGNTASLSDSIAIVGAPDDDENGTRSGSAYLFRPKPWRLSPINGHWYRLVDPATSVAAEAEAQTLGGHLATIRSLAENDWFHDTFAATEGVWIGYTDEDIEGSFEWTNGELPTFENWAVGQPDNSLGADWVVLQPGSGEWTDEPSLPEHMGVVEVISDDCDGDLLPDAFQIAQEPGLDWNGDGVLDACVTSNYCTATSNSTGQPATIGAAGTPVIADNAFTLQAQDIPLNEFGYFLMSESTAFIPGFGGSDGNLCLGAPIIRFNLQSDGGMVLNSGSTGTVGFSPDLGGLPQSTTLLPGDTWYFQLWFRDTSSSNTSDGIEVMFR